MTLVSFSKLLSPDLAYCCCRVNPCIIHTSSAEADMLGNHSGKACQCNRRWQIAMVTKERYRD